MPGEDGIDVMHEAYMKSPENLKFLASNYKALIDNYEPRKAASAVNVEDAPKMLWKGVNKPDKHDPVLSKLMPGTHLGAVSAHGPCSKCGLSRRTLALITSAIKIRCRRASRRWCGISPRRRRASSRRARRRSRSV